ncbi:cytochrome c3 family protein [Planctomicrobium sp. SH664]|uniref:cytochrome c3 family protein n=1 Tax=Planctomicrobium sp. SH664 TaxID=3448125 RepID=UPI003F5C5E1F
MPQVFHPSMNTFARVSIFGALFLVLALGGVVAAVARSPYLTEAGVVRSQPVPFSHQHHVGDVGIDCRYCHRSVETDAFAGIPASQVCMDCHSQLWATAPMLEPIRASVRDNKPVEWTRVNDLPDYVYFHHGIHVSKGIACETCHGRVDKMPLMWREKTLHMTWCLDCHREPEKFVRPKTDVLAFGWKPDSATPKPSELVDKHHITSQTNCSVCHR